MSPAMFSECLGLSSLPEQLVGRQDTAKRAVKCFFDRAGTPFARRPRVLPGRGHPRADHRPPKTVPERPKTAVGTVASVPAREFGAVSLQFVPLGPPRPFAPLTEKSDFSRRRPQAPSTAHSPLSETGGFVYSPSLSVERANRDRRPELSRP